jgi:HlyD family secretion protein
MACAKDTTPDAFGNLEAEEVIVSAQSSGQLERFDVREGDSLRVGDTVAVIDTVQMALERAQLLAQHDASLLQQEEVTRQSAATAVQRDIAQRTLDRTLRLLNGGAATAAQRDVAERDARVLAEQWNASRVTLKRIAAERAVLDARAAALDDRLRRARVRSPVAGTVLVTYVRAGEIVQPGQQLYRIASLDTLTLRAYVTGAQLASVRLGAPVTVHVDGESGLTARTGHVSWVSSRAEFTPTPVQTRDDRADLVYAVKVRVPNTDGRLKIGMPADVSLNAR